MEAIQAFVAFYWSGADEDVRSYLSGCARFIRHFAPPLPPPRRRAQPLMELMLLRNPAG
jgi:hypothetical protein